MKKSHVDVWICLDPVALYKAVKQEHYLFKALVEVAAGLSIAKVFFILDVTGFYQIELVEECTWLTTFNTFLAVISVSILPFGLTSAPEIFERKVSKMFEDVKGW